MDQNYKVVLNKEPSKNDLSLPNNFNENSINVKLTYQNFFKDDWKNMTTSLKCSTINKVDNWVNVQGKSSSVALRSDLGQQAGGSHPAALLRSSKWHQHRLKVWHGYIFVGHNKTRPCGHGQESHNNHITESQLHLCSPWQEAESGSLSQHKQSAFSFISCDIEKIKNKSDRAAGKLSDKHDN